MQIQIDAINTDDVEQQISYFVIFTPGEELVSIRHFGICEIRTAIFDTFWGFKMSTQISHVYSFFTCEELVDLGTKYVMYWY